MKRYRVTIVLEGDWDSDKLLESDKHYIKQLIYSMVSKFGWPKNISVELSEADEIEQPPPGEDF